MTRIIFNRNIIIKNFRTSEYIYLKILFRNEVETRITGINHDTISFYRVPKTTKLTSYYPKLQDEIDSIVFVKIEEANDIYLRR